MDTILDLIFATFRVLAGEPEMAAHPREAFGDEWKSLRKGLNRELHDRFGHTLGRKPTMSDFVRELTLVTEDAHIKGEDSERGLDVTRGATKIASRAHALEVAQEEVSLTREAVTQERTLNEQARKVRDGEVVRDHKGRIMSREVAEIFA